MIVGGPSMKALNTRDQIREHSIPQHNSTYYNNKTLSEEGNYTAKRQREAGMIGNNLEKPQIFLRRELVRETSQIQEELQGQKPF